MNDLDLDESPSSPQKQDVQASPEDYAHVLTSPSSESLLEKLEKQRTSIFSKARGVMTKRRRPKKKQKRKKKATVWLRIDDEPFAAYPNRPAFRTTHRFPHNGFNINRHALPGDNGSFSEGSGSVVVGITAGTAEFRQATGESEEMHSSTSGSAQEECSFEESGSEDEEEEEEFVDMDDVDLGFDLA